MFKLLRNIAVVAVVALSTTGCFKKVTTDTKLCIKVLTEEVSGGARVPSEGCYGYIYYVNSEWSIASYEDAATKTITNQTTGEKRSLPDGESEPYEMEGSANNYISIFQGERQALVVVVNPAVQMYAYLYRNTEAENLAHTYLTVIFRPWKTESYVEGSKDGYKWTVVVPEVQQPETPESPETPGEGTETPENPEEETETPEEESPTE